MANRDLVRKTFCCPFKVLASLNAMKGILVFLFILALSYAAHFLYTGLPIITGFLSKVVCSGHYISHRPIEDCFYDAINPFAKLVTIEGFIFRHVSLKEKNNISAMFFNVVDMKRSESIRACIDILGFKLACQESFYTKGIGCTRGSRPQFDTNLVEKLKKERNV